MGYSKDKIITDNLSVSTEEYPYSLPGDRLSHKQKQIYSYVKDRHQRKAELHKAGKILTRVTECASREQQQQSVFVKSRKYD